jgi:putative membrane protein
MKKLLVPALLAAMFCAACDKDDDLNENAVNTMDRNFTLMASMSNTAEIDAGQLAATKGNEPGIRTFGQMMVTDHSDAKAQMATLATSLQLYAPDSLDARHVALKAQLMSLSGFAFDSVYIHNQVIDHQNTITLFQAERDNGNNRQLREFAVSMLPHLQHHLHMADSIAAHY